MGANIKKIVHHKIVAIKITTSSQIIWNRSQGNAIKTKPTTIIIYNGKSIYKKENTKKIFKATDQYEHQVTLFSDHLLKNKKVDYDLKDAHKNMKVLDATFESIKKGKWIKLPWI